ncbi:MAG TPA: hypothetical protein GX523_06040 [Desulfitobacterium dehalogenans]|uniref:Uncharacterized protein n=1 Tax=Desulfitobacterium dehalogenans TaxID=36854 RepID=A0A7C7D950_9FIRM|nr:hypothetical protein [Desulfitobacterium dehalogenans]
MKLKELWSSFKNFIGYCPYYKVGTQVAKKVSGKKQPLKKSKSPNDEEKNLIEGMKTGRNITLIGFFCPIFWYSLFMGSPKDVVLFNAAHSGIFIAIGVVLYLINASKLRKIQESSTDNKGIAKQ